MKIKSYNFGEIVINGKTYTSDVIVYPDRIRSDWWRIESHRLQTEDITEVINFRPEVIVVGTGASGLMRVTEELKSKLKEKNIQLFALPTADAVKKFNALLEENRKVVGCFHLTC
ncbi:MAG: Mth938-like domain-containing protein [Elusimicrobiota bacterium]|nr:Mth938-like domain-containing protein [Elusimicrobiota bacterium]